MKRTLPEITYRPRPRPTQRGNLTTQQERKPWLVQLVNGISNYVRRWQEPCHNGRCSK
jgi:hypothetical protein